MGIESQFELRNTEEVLKRPFVCSVTIGGRSVNIFSEFREFLPHFNREAEYVNDIPGWRVDYSQVSLAPSIIYLPSDTAQFSYNEDTRTILVQGKPEDFHDGQALAYIGFWLTEGERQKDSIFTVHASSLTIEGKGVLIIGDGGSGKTSVALGLIDRYNSELISNDLSIVQYDEESGGVTLHEGSKVVRLRLGSVKARFPNLISFFVDEDQPAWITKVAVKPEELGIKIADGTKSLAGAFTIHLDSNFSEPLTKKRVDNIEVQFELYENLSRIVRGSAISIFGSNKDILGYLPSLESQPTHQNKVNLINYLVKKMGIWHISGGSLDEICKAIFGHLDSN